MPDRDNTGPSGRFFFGGRREGCWFERRPVQEGRTVTRPEESKEVVYGVGRGGRPRGGGRGNCYGGKRKGRQIYH